METYYYILIVLVGLALGSFFNVVIFRFPAFQKQGFWKPLSGRSKCVNCKSVIKWFDLIPIVSYFLLKARCRKCGAKISPMYPIVEISTAAVLLLLFLKTPLPSYLTALDAFIILLFVLIVFIDIRYLIIPDGILALLIAVMIGLKIMSGSVGFFYLLVSALGLTSFFGILFLVSKGKWIGLGDIKLIFLIGFLLGYPASYIVVISSVWLATIFSTVLLILKKATMKTEIPFGSFLSVATIIFLIFSNELQKISRYFY